MTLSTDSTPQSDHRPASPTSSRSRRSGAR